MVFLPKLSRMARLYWPHFFVAANDCGRIGINYLTLAAGASARGYWHYTP